MSIQPKQDYTALLQGVEAGRCLDLDKKGNLVVVHSKLALWKHVYDPQEYASKVFSAIVVRLENASNPDEIVQLKKLATSVSGEYRELNRENRLSPTKAKILSVFSKILHYFHKKTQPRHAVWLVMNEMQHLFAEKTTGGTLPDSSGLVKKIIEHRNPSEKVKKEYNGATNITAQQGKYLAALQKTPPREWDVMKLDDASGEKKLAIALVLDVEEKLQLRELSSTRVADIPDGECKNVLQRLAAAEDLHKPVSDLIKKCKGDDKKALLQAIKAEAKSRSKPFSELEKIPLQDRVKDLKKDDPLKVITTSRLKEVAARQAYRQDLPAKIAGGAYNPAIIKAEIASELLVGVIDPIPLGMRTTTDVKEEIRIELKRILSVPGIGLTKEQARFIRHDANHLLDLYVKAYPDKSVEQQYVLARDVVRAVVYQEMHDKSSFTGSDHGAKHVHHNTKNADGLHEHMHHGDYNAKDQFLEHLVHAYHDMGYTVGLGATNFDCCKDHPFIGAKMIEENKDYFVKLLDNESYEVLQDSILCHAIAVFDMTPDAVEANGIHRNLVRAVTSISDACAVTYDRKTQEFWEQPGALISLSRLKLFLTQYPAYKSILSHPNIITDEWAGLDPNSSMDKMAHDIFQGTKARLLHLADTYELAPDRASLFKQAIHSQFNAFTANTTLGQYGAVLTGVEAIENEDMALGDPKYIPQFNMAPSVIYGVLSDLFGQDQAIEAFKKLVEEAGGDLKDIQSDIQQMAKALGQKLQPEAKQKKTGVAFFKIHQHTDVEMPVKSSDKAYAKHMRRLQKGLVQATKALAAIYSETPITPAEKAKLFEELDKMRKGEVQKSFQQYLAGIAAAIPPKDAAAHEKRWLPVIKNAAILDEKLRQCVDGESFKKIKDVISMLLMTTKEYEFMMGESKGQVLPKKFYERL